jgi:hypothetical protein
MTPKAFEMIQPISESHDYSMPMASDPRLRQVLGQFSVFTNVTGQAFETVHPSAADKAEEDFLMLETSFASHSFGILMNLPSYNGWLRSARSSEAWRKAYKNHCAFLKQLQWQRAKSGGAGEHWLLKMPFHLMNLEDLFAAYPDARVIHTHRAPSEVLPSWLNLVQDLRKGVSSDIDCKALGEEQTELMEAMVTSSMDFWDRHPSLQDRCIHVHFQDLMADPVGQVSQIYRKLQLPLPEGLRQEIRGFVEDQKRSFKSAIPASLETFGLSAELVDKRKGFAAYKKCHGDGGRPLSSLRGLLACERRR